MEANNDVQSVKKHFSSGHKYNEPLPLASSIQRTQLLNELIQNDTYAAVVIQGPAGHGKTTLMQQVYQKVKSEGAHVGWLTLDDSDNDISRFSSCLTMLVNNTLKEISPQAGIDTQGLGTLDYVLYRLDNTQENVFLFFDEFQAMTTKSSLHLINTLIERCPPNITICIGSRTIPSIAYSRLMINGRVKWITPEELCFSVDEVLTFLHLVGLEISLDEAKAFHERTGGWPAVLQLLQLALKGGRLKRTKLLDWAGDCQNDLRDYLADNVMSHHDLETRQFLMRTSLLRRLSASLCEHITGEPNLQEVLEGLVNQGLFIRSLDAQNNWFKYHSIFSSYLTTLLQKVDQSAIEPIHSSAAKWFYANGDHYDSIFHAISAEDFTFAAEILEDWMPELIRTARLSTVEQFSELIPEEVFKERPMLVWGKTWALSFLNQIERAQQSMIDFENIVNLEGENSDHLNSLLVIKCVEVLMKDELYSTLPWLDSVSVETGDMPKYRCFEMSALANAKAISRLQEDRFTEAREFALLGQSMGIRGEATFSSAYSTSLLAYSMILDGHLDQALKQIHTALNEEKIKVQGSFASASLSAAYGFALYESGQFYEAESHLRDAIEMISLTLPTDWLISAYISLARASCYSEQEDADSLEILDQGERLGLVKKSNRLVRAMRRERIRFMIINRKKNEVKHLDAMFEPLSPNTTGWGYFAEGCDDELIYKLRMNIYSDTPENLTSLYEEAINETINSSHVRRKIKLLILRSLEQSILGNSKVAEAYMQDAVESAASGNYLAAFIEEGARCLEIIKAVFISKENNLSNKCIEFLRKILSYTSTLSGSSSDVLSENSLIEPLSKKEKNIVKLVIEGATNSEIADQLFISKNTVKFHLKNIYEKLGVSNRVQAVGVARKLNLELSN